MAIGYTLIKQRKVYIILCKEWIKELRFPQNSQKQLIILQKDYTLFNDEFNHFFPELISHIKKLKKKINLTFKVERNRKSS